VKLNEKIGEPHAPAHSLASSTRYRREQASGTSSVAEDPARDRQTISFFGAFDATARSLYNYFDYFPKAVRDLHDVHFPPLNLYDYTD
jgi:hypothetical protein